MSPQLCRKIAFEITAEIKGAMSCRILLRTRILKVLR